ncbi:Ras-related protein Rab-24 [Chionoecetes opilio]|uniref:Ras-related protein Rab-24 n=1 Tax=Chionoecetes opilio TaxID=41210 RepID=A0A8J5D5U8_CHIOP|nr:Ras-related protein Rab-24 [Chionoecetes opilio]
MSRKVDMKVVMLGQSSCGKTSMVERFIYKRFNHNYQATIGAAFGARCVPVRGTDVCVGLWDTAGSERYEAMSHIYFRGAKAAVVCYDITNQESAERAKFWVAEVQKYEEGCRVCLCGTKLDLVQDSPKARQVDVHDMTDYVETIGGRLFETSSKTGENVEELFDAIVQDFAEHAELPPPPQDLPAFSLHTRTIRARCC